MAFRVQNSVYLNLVHNPTVIVVFMFEAIEPYARDNTRKGQVSEDSVDYYMTVFRDQSTLITCILEERLSHGSKVLKSFLGTIALVG